MSIIRKTFGKLRNRLKKELLEKQPLSARERKRIRNMERYKPAEVNVFSKKLHIVDSTTFLSSFDEIFKSHIYKFQTDKQDIVIIDCGANIGLATIYFKINFPASKVVAFEADPNIFKVMKKNIASLGFENVTCVNEAVSDADGTINFILEGGHSGMITKEAYQNSVSVRSCRLKKILNNYENITFLKMDIEGHETKVLPDIAEELKKVDFLFLEYHSFLNAEQKLDEILGIIKKAGLRYYIKEAYNKPLPYIKKEIFLNMDMLVNIFCYRN